MLMKSTPFETFGGRYAIKDDRSICLDRFVSIDLSRSLRRQTKRFQQKDEDDGQNEAPLFQLK